MNDGWMDYEGILVDEKREGASESSRRKPQLTRHNVMPTCCQSSTKNRPCCQATTRKRPLSQSSEIHPTEQALHNLI